MNGLHERITGKGPQGNRPNQRMKNGLGKETERKTGERPYRKQLGQECRTKKIAWTVGEGLAKKTRNGKRAGGRKGGTRAARKNGAGDGTTQKGRWGLRRPAGIKVSVGGRTTRKLPWESKRKKIPGKRTRGNSVQDIQRIKP